ncbi:hypothetical protein BEP19_10710 [Ammoniphilus oxalaticus]|uniref:Bacterial spore germination immunoglobulin-like domain-containing protein n=1 Tax=Ammoniphilus oxalaticus TaxID=66863 RepID=A0A419SG16_9BACL|nr:Gmad2 immunoglobulin-like domain-containing protein [Ammoniphilus oxalaticus]RKD22719.1 hypothetical protein BEP19_10710 [Ammoniphilus oxalaticus]
MKIFFKPLMIGLLVIALGVGCSPTQDEDQLPEEPNEQIDPQTDGAQEDGQVEADDETRSEETVDESEPTPKITAENEAFRIYKPDSDTVIENRLIIKGEARVFEGTVQYYLEDGHNILAEGFTQASAGGPEWGEFEVDVEIEQATSPNGMLILFEESAKDSSQLHKLVIPVKFMMP